MRYQFSIASLLALILIATFATIWIRPYFLPPLQWQEFSSAELRTQRDLGKTVIVYFRDDWWDGFDQLQTELLDSQSMSAIRKHNGVLMVASNTLNNNDAEIELKRVSGSNIIPTVVVYCPKKSVSVLKHPVTASALADTLYRIAK